MALNHPLHVVYHTTAQQKLQAKNTAHKYKFGSPKIRDVLREKCRARVKEARKSRFDNARENVNREALIKRFLREEVAELEEDIKLQELIYEEMMQEVDEWFIEEYEKQENYLLDEFEEQNIFCPVCQKHCIESTNRNEFRCNCGSSFYYENTLQDFYIEIQLLLRGHDHTCDQELTFFVEPEENGNRKLRVICKHCDYFYSF